MANKSFLRFSYHPFLFATYPLLFFYSFNQDELIPEIIVFPIIISLSVSLIILIISKIILGNWQKSAIFTSSVILTFFSYGHLTAPIKNTFIPIKSGLVIGPNKILFPIVILLLFFFAFKAKKSQSHWNSPSIFFNVVAVILVFIQLSTIYRKEMQLTRTISNTISSQDSQKNFESYKPDIYFIVLDAYARSDTLNQIFNYDNSDFISSLETLGFKVAQKATSNYAHTTFSLSSSLNLTYINDWVSESDKEPVDLSFAHAMIHENQAALFLKERGYKIINFASGWGPTDDLLVADINYRNGNTFTFLSKKIGLNEFYMIFLQTTALSPFIKDALADQARANVLYAFDKLTEVPFQRGKKFVIAHFNIPHPPFLFDEHGEPIPRQALELAGESFTDRENYLKQMLFTTKRIQDTIEKILSRSESPPIIILQSDHGPATILGHPHKWARPPVTEGVKERMYILYAYYAPDAEEFFYDSITPVNTFRILFKDYFGADYEIVPDRNYFTDGNIPFKFLEVTNELKEGYKSTQ